MYQFFFFNAYLIINIFGEVLGWQNIFVFNCISPALHTPNYNTILFKNFRWLSFIHEIKSKSPIWVQGPLPCSTHISFNIICSAPYIQAIGKCSAQSCFLSMQWKFKCLFKRMWWAGLQNSHVRGLVDHFPSKITI